MRLSFVFKNSLLSRGALPRLVGTLGVAGMWLAIFADVGVLILCVLNATRAMPVKKL